MMALPQGPDDYIRPAVGFLNVDYAFRKLEERAKINIKLSKYCRKPNPLNQSWLTRLTKKRYPRSAAQQNDNLLKLT
jgi:hypothetical protein